MYRKSAPCRTRSSTSSSKRDASGLPSAFSGTGDSISAMPRASAPARNALTLRTELRSRELNITPRVSMVR